MSQPDVHDGLRAFLKPYAAAAFEGDDPDAWGEILAALANGLGFCAAMAAKGDPTEVEAFLTAADQVAIRGATEAAPLLKRKQ